MAGAHDDVVRTVMAEVTRDRLIEAVSGLVDTASPTGAEAPLAGWIVDHLGTAGVPATCQHLDDHQANAVGVLPGGAGSSLLLYAPIDTFTTGDPAEDVPWMSSDFRPDMAPRAKVNGDLVIGLGAGNPKGHAACVLVAMEALARSGVSLPGRLVAGFGAGGMPTFAVPGVGAPGRVNTGHGVGAGFLLERGGTTDAAVIAKPGWQVSHEEVGLVWVDVVVPGIHTYVGSRHRLPYRNAIAQAGRVAIHLEEWLEGYADRHEYETMRPQGVVASITSGSARMAAATPAQVRLRLDLRLTTEQTPDGVTREVAAELARLDRRLEADLTVEQVAAIPATRTPPDHRFVAHAVAAWETVAGERHRPTDGNSGATDANILRMRGVPTVRIGMPKVTSVPGHGDVDFTLGMNVVDVAQMRRLVEVLVRIVLAD